MKHCLQYHLGCNYSVAIKSYCFNSEFIFTKGIRQLIISIFLLQ